MIEEKEDRFMLFKRGDESVFRLYYERYYHALCLWVLRMIKDEEKMHDMVQEAFITLWQSRETIESELHLKMFLYQVVRNKCINYLKNRKVEEKYVCEYLKTEEELFEDSVLEEEVHRLIIQEIERLPEEQKKVVYFHLEGKNNLEIAEIMRVSVNTVKTHKARARKTLKSKFDNLFIINVLLGL